MSKEVWHTSESADDAGLGHTRSAGAETRWTGPRARLVSGRERLAWTLIGVGVCLAAVGVLVVGAVFVIQGDAPAFGWTDLFFVGTYVLVIGGAAVLPQVPESPG